MPCLNYREGGGHNSCVLLVILFYNVKSCVKRLEDGGSFEEWFSSKSGILTREHQLSPEIC